MAVACMARSSASPTSPRVRSERTRWTLTTSANPSSCSCGTARTPISAALAGSRFWLQATTSMPNAWPTAAIRAPIRPRPSSPRVAPVSSVPTVVCHPPSRTACASAGMWRSTDRISPHVSSAVLALAPPGVPHTITPRSAAAATSMAALPGAVVTSSSRSGSRPNSSASKRVRSRMATST